VPTNVQITQINGTWRLGFASEVANDGPGYLKITGNGPGNALMVADQVVQMSDGTSETVPAVGEMHYVIGGGHEHWHLLDFERYELRSAADAATPIVRDQKTGFCLADAFTTDLCGRNHPELTTVSEGIAARGSDKYLGYLEGQYLLLDPVTTPAGDYLLVNRANPTGALLESDPSDNASSLRLAVTWSETGAPSMKITNICPASIDCPPPPALPTDAQAQPQPPQPIDSSVGQVTVTPVAEPVPIVPPSQLGAATRTLSMSRSMAARLVRRAIAKSLRAAPRVLRMTCARRATATFSCRATWRGPTAARWSARVRVWYQLRDNRLGWRYDLTAVRRADGRRVNVHAARGSASRAVFAGPSGSLYCAVAAPE